MHCMPTDSRFTSTVAFCLNYSQNSLRRAHTWSRPYRLPDLGFGYCEVKLVYT